MLELCFETKYQPPITTPRLGDLVGQRVINLMRCRARRGGLGSRWRGGGGVEV